MLCAVRVPNRARIPCFHGFVAPLRGNHQNFKHVIQIDGFVDSVLVDFGKSFDLRHEAFADYVVDGGYAPAGRNQARVSFPLQKRRR